MVLARPWDRFGNTGPGGEEIWCGQSDCDRPRSNRNRDGERKRAAKQVRRGRFPGRGCPAMEVSSQDRYHYSKSLQRIAHRDLAKTEMCGVADSVRCFAGTRASVGLRAKEKSNRRGGDAPAREMDCNASSRDRNIDLQFVRPAELYSAAPRNKTADKNVRWGHRQDAYVPVVERRR